MTAAHPISIDAVDFADRASGAGATRRLNALRKQFEGRRVLVGVDRLELGHSLDVVAVMERFVADCAEGLKDKEAAEAARHGLKLVI